MSPVTPGSTPTTQKRTRSASQYPVRTGLKPTQKERRKPDAPKPLVDTMDAELDGADDALPLGLEADPPSAEDTAAVANVNGHEVANTNEYDPLLPKVQKNTRSTTTGGQRGRPKTRVLGNSKTDAPVRPSIYLDPEVAETITFIAKVHGISVNVLLQGWVIEAMKRDPQYQVCKEAADNLMNARKTLLARRGKKGNTVIDSPVSDEEELSY